MGFKTYNSLSPRL